MAVTDVREWLGERGKDVMEFEESSATVELAALAVGVIPARIAKTLSFYEGEGAMLIVTAGDARTDNKKFKGRFGFKARMLTPDDVESFTGHKIGGVCPFALKRRLAVYLDVSLKRFETVFPACGSANSAIEITPDELANIAGAQWVDVCSGYDGSVS